MGAVVNLSLTAIPPPSLLPSLPLFHPLSPPPCLLPSPCLPLPLPLVLAGLGQPGREASDGGMLRCLLTCPLCDARYSHSICCEAGVLPTRPLCDVW
eukprot:555065-Rhodomonas_salina.1